MAHILVFDSDASELEDGSSADEMNLDGSPNEFRRSMAVRLFTKSGHIENISYEFLYRSLDDLATTPALRWYQEFYNDRAHVGEIALDGEGAGNIPPGGRTFPESDPNDGWAREQTEEVTAGTGTTDHYNITRQLTLAANTCRYFPMVVHSLWVRLVIWTPDNAFPGRLIVHAVTGGLGASAYLENELTAPYQYIVQ